jgi:hypothetical protein
MNWTQVVSVFSAQTQTQTELQRLNGPTQREHLFYVPEKNFAAKLMNKELILSEDLFFSFYI